MGSVRHLGVLARTWLSRLPTVHSLRFIERHVYLGEGYALAARFCDAVGTSLEDVVSSSALPTRPADPPIRLPAAFLDAVDTSCAYVVRRRSQIEARSSSKHGIEIVRLIALICRHDHQSAFAQVARACGGVASDVAGGTIEPPELGLSAMHRPTAILRDAAGRPFHEMLPSPMAGAAAPGDLALPNTYGLDLLELRSLIASYLGSTTTRKGVNPVVMQYNPVRVVCDSSELLADGSGSEGANEAPRSQGKGAGLGGALLFPPVDWDGSVLARYRYDQREFDATVAVLRRKAKDSATSPHRGKNSFFSYGVLRDIETTVYSGRSVIVTGISGSGKSTLLSRLAEGVAHVFEIGSGVGESDTGKRSYRMGEMPRLFRCANATKGFKLLIVHEFMLTPGLLCCLSVFDQIIIVGDERQPSPLKNAKHLFKFINLIGGQRFELSVIWRATHPGSLSLANFLAYGNRFRICPQGVLEKGDAQFQVVECDDDPQTVAASMVSYACKRAREGKGVMVAVSDGIIKREIEAIVDRSDGVMRDLIDTIDFRMMDDLQGRQADVLVADLHDVATHVRDPHEALRFVLMVLGRARRTTCWLLGARNVACDPSTALPVEVVLGVLLRWRVALQETRFVLGTGPAYEEMHRHCGLVQIDEETIAVTIDKWGQAIALIIKSRASHNATMIGDSHSLIEAAVFFDGTTELAREYETIGRLAQSGVFPKRGISTIDDIDDHNAKYPINPDRSVKYSR